MSTYADIPVMSAYVDIDAMSPYGDIVPEPTYLAARSLPRLGSAIRRLRHDRGWTQADLAERAGVTRQWVVAIEKGDTPGAEIALVMRALDALNASLVVRDEDPGS